jgi:hypothetical protein
MNRVINRLDVRGPGIDQNPLDPAKPMAVGSRS